MAEQLTIRVVDGGGARSGSGTGRPGPTAPAAPASQQTGGSARAAVEAAGSTAAVLAAGNAGAAVSSVASRALAALTGPIGIAAVAVAASFGAVAIAARTLTNAFKAQVDLLAGFSGEVSTAVATSQFRQEIATLRRAQRLGPDLAAFETQRSRWQTALFDVNTEILAILLRIFNLLEPFVEPILRSLEAIADIPEQLASELRGFEKLLRLNGQTFLADLLKGFSEILDDQDEKRQEKSADPFFGLFDNLGPQQ